MTLISSVSALRLFSHLLIVLVAVAILSPSGTQAGPIYEIVSPDINGINGGISTEGVANDNVLTAPTAAEYSQSSKILKTPNSDPYSPYMQGMTSPLGEDDLEYSIDYYNEKTLMKEYDFNSADILEKLTNSAISNNTPPSQFLEEIQDLISLQNRSRSEQNESVDRDDASKLQSGFLSETLLKRMTEGWKNELKRLEKKYNVSSECTDSQAITATRLSLMFPHYLNFGQKPIAAPTNITFDFGGGSHQVCEYDRNYGGQRCRYENNIYQVPSIFRRQELGGLIPSPGRFSNETVREVIVGVHLYALHRNDHNDMVPFRTKCEMLNRRMQKSVLSDERRIRFLINNDIITKNGTLLKTVLNNAYNKIPSDFKAKIDWALLNY